MSPKHFLKQTSAVLLSVRYCGKVPTIPHICHFFYTAQCNVYFVKYDVTVSFLAQVLDTVTYLVPQVLDTAS